MPVKTKFDLSIFLRLGRHPVPFLWLPLLHATVLGERLLGRCKHRILEFQLAVRSVFVFLLLTVSHHSCCDFRVWYSTRHPTTALPNKRHETQFFLHQPVRPPLQG